MSKTARRAVVACAAVLAIAVVLPLGVVIVQGRQAPSGAPDRVALGSSFAAGYGIGDRAPGSPFACFRGDAGYPRDLSRFIPASLVDRTCSGSTAQHILHGGQYFQPAQIEAVAPATQIVTVTTGGNDLSYVGDLTVMSRINQGGVWGWVAEHMLTAPHAEANRDYGGVETDIAEIVREVRKRSPTARVAVVTYPAILPETGSCPALGLTTDQVSRMRPVASRLAAATRRAAAAEGATLVDMASLSSGHDACSSKPWTNGFDPKSGDGASFHPTKLGAEMTAKFVAQALGIPAGSPQ